MTFHLKFDPRAWLAAPFLIFTADRLLKSIARSGTEFSLFPSFLEFSYFANPGIAFSIPFSGIPLIVISLIAVSIAGYALYRAHRNERTGHVFALLLFILGAVSNLWDRLALGTTTDYLIVFGLSAVNMADAMIVVGALMLFFSRSGRSLSA